MATVESHSHHTDHQASPSIPSDAMAVDATVNGIAHQHNSNIPTYASSVPDQQPQSSLPQQVEDIPQPATSDATIPVKLAQQQPSQVDSEMVATAPLPPPTAPAPHFDTPVTKSSPSPMPTPPSSFPAPGVAVAHPSNQQDNTPTQNGIVSAAPESVPQAPVEPLAPVVEPQQDTPMNGGASFEVQSHPTLADAAQAYQPELSNEREAPVPVDPAKSGLPDSKPEPEFATTAMTPATEAASELPKPTSMDLDMTDVSQTSIKIAREREDDEEETEPVAKRTKTDEESALEVDDGPSPVLPTTEMSSPSAAQDPTIAVVNGTQPVATAANATPPVPLPTAEEWGPMTDTQVKQLKQVLANMKKGRFASSFSKPVDPVALNIPTYFDVVKQPMDLSTIDAKLKEGKYDSVAAFISDFDLIVDNCIKFNGPNHPISIQGGNLRAQFHAGLRKVSKAGDPAPPPPQLQLKKHRSSVSLPARDAKVRQSRPSLPNESSEPTFALGANGIPLTRRTSANDGRPKREIHRPPPRDLPYLSAKPKKKKFQMELRFCEHVLSELKKGRYAHLMSPFAVPVDPVALNIPQYHKIVKKPMDFGTISDKLANGQYENAKEFETDVHQVFENCFKFNGTNHPISQLARQFQDIFNAEMSHKSTWVSHNAPSSAPQSPEIESESEEGEEDDEDDEDLAAEEARKAAELKAIHEQMAALTAKAVELANPTVVSKKAKTSKKASKPAKAGGSKSAQRKSGPVAVSRPEKKASKAAKAKPARALTKKEEMEVCNRMGELTGDETSMVYTWIQDGRKSEGLEPLPESPEGAVELTLEAIPNAILHRILGLIHSHDPQSDYRPVSVANQSRHSAAAAVPHRKKHKPMRMNEQTAAIERVQSQLASFDNQGLRTPSDSPTGAGRYNGQSDDDDDDSGSESEEE